MSIYSCDPGMFYLGEVLEEKASAAPSSTGGASRNNWLTSRQSKTRRCFPFFFLTKKGVSRPRRLRRSQEPRYLPVEFRLTDHELKANYGIRSTRYVTVPGVPELDRPSAANIDDLPRGGEGLLECCTHLGRVGNPRPVGLPIPIMRSGRLRWRKRRFERGTWLRSVWSVARRSG